MSSVLDQLEPMGIVNPDGVKHSIIEVILQLNFAEPLVGVMDGEWRERVTGSPLFEAFPNHVDYREISFSFQKEESGTLDVKPTEKKIHYSCRLNQMKPHWGE